MNHRLVIAAVFLAGGAISSAAQSPSINGRSTIAKALIAGSPKLRDGSFNAGGVSGVCGVIPKEVIGEAIFVIEFPNDTPTGTITSISFGSKELVGGVTRSTVFRLNVGVRTANGGTPPLYVLNTDSGNAKVTGIAILTEAKGVITLRVTGQEIMGETIDLTVVCS